MPTTLRVATFNCENLFSRPKLINFTDHAQGDALLKQLSELQKELNRATYDKPKIRQLATRLADYITVVETRASSSRPPAPSSRAGARPGRGGSS